MATPGIMQDSYIGGIVSSSFIQQEIDASPFVVESSKDTKKADDILGPHLFGGKPASAAWDTEQSNNQTDEDKIIRLTCTDEAKQTNINKTEEYNIGYSGLSILPWEEFVFNPRCLNDLFYQETNAKITYDPDEVNVFFHGKNVMPPSVGDISENGRSWNIVVNNMAELRRVRGWLTERCSVFGVTLEYKDGKFSKPERAPCLVLLDPSKGSLGDRLYTTLTRAMDSLHNQRSFCIEINLNSCVERWCNRVLLTECKAVGAKICITNGEEYEHMDGAEDMVCCILCFPVWLIQNGVYKLHRKVVYDDFLLTFDAEDLFLHGAVQDFSCQRAYIFNESGKNAVFRTRCAEQTDVKTLQALGSHKFVCVKKADDDEIIEEHRTSTFGALVKKRKYKVMAKESKLRKSKSKDKHSYAEEDYVDNDDTERKVEYDSSDSDYDDDEHVGECDSGDTESYVNKGYAHDDETIVKQPYSEGPSPRIPEISSIQCDDKPDYGNELEIPSEVKSDTSIFSPRSSGSQSSVLAPLPASDFRRKRDNKSLTAVCSFEFGNDDDFTDGEETSEDEVKGKSDHKTKPSNEELIDELAKIDKTRVSIVESVPDAGKPNEEESKSGKAEEDGKKGKDKLKLGKALKDLTKTTTAANAKTDLPSKEDPRYKEAKEKIKQEKQLTKLKLKEIKKESTKRQKEKPKDKTLYNKASKSKTKSKGETPIESTETKPAGDIRDSVEYVTEDVNEDSDGESDASEDNVREDEVMEIQKTQSETCNITDDFKSSSDNAITEFSNMVADFSVDGSSTDGDDVEMIYQNEKETNLRTASRASKDAIVEESAIDEIDDVDPLSEVPDISELGDTVSAIDTVASNNKIVMSKTLDQHVVDVDIMYDDVDEANVGPQTAPKNVFGKGVGQSRLPMLGPHKPVLSKQPMSKVTEVVSSGLDNDMDVTDIDEEGNEITATASKGHSGSNASNVPPLKLNFSGDKKAKRSLNKRNDSSGKYLGASVPSKSRKMPKY